MQTSGFKDERRNPLGGFLLHRWYCVAIGIERDADGRMAQSLTDNFRVHASGQSEGCVRVPKIMEPNAWQPRGLS